MIVYRELASLCYDLGFSARALYYASNTVNKHYSEAFIPKGNGGVRILHVPDKFMKAIQKCIAKNILAYEEISPYATAYRILGSTRVNAAPHVGHNMVLKLDIRKFFDYITYAMVKNKVFVKEKYSEANRILLSVLCVYRDTIPQGAPTSPVISNIIMRDFDNIIGKWCSMRNITYTRYCDDMTFSGDSFNAAEVIHFVSAELRKQGFWLNRQKTVLLKNGQRKKVTGIVVNEKMSVAADYKKKIRQEMYYLKKYGLDSHAARINIKDTNGYIDGLLGRINYVISIEKNNKEIMEYREWIQRYI